MKRESLKRAILIVPFVGMLIALFFIGNEPIWDERLFMPTVKEFGKNYFPTLSQIELMNSPMGPVFFSIWGFIGKLFDFNIFWMRMLHICISFGFILLIFEILSKSISYPLVATLLFMANPYFLVMTGPLLYTDVTALLFAFGGIYMYLYRQNRFWTALLFGIAVCTRQLLIILPISMFLTDLYRLRQRELKWFQLWPNVIPAILFLPLFVLWGYNVNSGAFVNPGQFEENTLKAFNFSFKKLNYCILLIGLYALPFSFHSTRTLIFSKRILYVFPFLLMLFLGFPVEVNEGLTYGNLPNTAGLFDILFVKIGYASFLIIPILFLMAMSFIYLIIDTDYSKNTLFLKLTLLLFVILESIYSYCWDKHFLLVIPLIIILCNGLGPIRQLPRMEKVFS